MPVTLVVIPNWNGRHLLARCLGALAAQTYRDFAVVIADNGSTDGSVEYVSAHFPDVLVIANAENRGFAVATNQGIRALESRYVATLNNDTEVDPGWLASLIAAMESAPDVGMCASKMLFADRPTMINSTGICVDRVGIAWDCRGGEPDDPDEVEPVEVFGPCAGAALYRRSMLDAVGLFDEDFFLYMEDVDLAWRARAAGWRCLHVPAARVIHHHSATSGEGSPLKSFHLGRNKVWLLLKNYPARALWHHIPLVVVYDMAGVLFALAARRDVHALRGRLAGFAGAVRMLRKRQALASRPDAIYLSSLVWPWKVTERYRHLRLPSHAKNST